VLQIFSIFSSNRNQLISIFLYILHYPQAANTHLWPLPSTCVDHHICLIVYMKNLRLILNFYISFAFASTGITLSCMYLLYVLDFRAFVALFWFKVITLAGIYYIVNIYKRREYYYYRNMGLSKRNLWIPIFSIEFLLFISTQLFTYHLK